MSTNKTVNLNLPQYELTDTFNLTEINESYDKIDKTYKEIKDNYELAIETSTIAGSIDNLELIDARGGKPKVKDRFVDIESSLAEKVSQSDFDTKIGNMGNTKTFKGSVLFANLPTSGNTIDNYYYVSDQDTNYCWNGTAWINIGNNLNLGNKSITLEKLYNSSLSLQGNSNDGIYEIGYIDNGVEVNYTDCVRNVNFIEVMSNKTIYFVRGNNTKSKNYLWVTEYDNAKQFIKMTMIYDYSQKTMTHQLQLSATTKYIRTSMDGTLAIANGIEMALYYAEYGKETYENYSSPYKINGESIEVNNSTLTEEISNIKNYIISKKPTICFLFDGIEYDNRSQLLGEMKATYSIGDVDATLYSEHIKNHVKNGDDISVYSGLGTFPTSYLDDTAWLNFIKAEVEKLNLLGVYLPTQYGCKGHKGSKSITKACRDLGFKYISCNYELNNGETWDTDTGIVWNNIIDNSSNKMLMCPFTMPTKTFEQIKTQIDDCVSKNYVLPLFSHHVSVDGNGGLDVTTDVFTQVVEYVRTLKNNGSVDVLTMRQLYNKYNIQEAKELDYTRIMSGIVDR